MDDVVGWAASLDPSPDVIHIDLRSPTRNSYLGGRAWATTLWRELRRQLPSLKFLHLTPQPATLDQLLNSMRTNPVGKPKCNYEANPRYCTFANSWSAPCRDHSTCLYLCTVLLLRLVHET